MKISEKVLAYLEDSMSADERISFEAELSANNELKKELEFQDELIESIKSARKAELKGMLNSIAVPKAPTFFGSGIGKTLTGAAITGLVLYGVYNFNTDSPEESVSTERSQVHIQQDNKNIPEEINNNSSIIMKDESADVDHLASEPIESQQETLQEISQTSNSANSVNNKVIESDRVDIPSAITGFENQESVEINVPDNHLTDDYNNEESMAIEIVTNDRKHDFHYQIKDNQLRLYGDFSKTYEVLDFMDNNQRSIFLYYSGKYYPLSLDNEKITALEELKDTSVIKSLNATRKK